MIPIIMQTYNRIEYSMQVIAAFMNHILYPHKIIIIDNGSTDGTPEYLKLMLRLKIIDRLILNKENRGIAEPKNQGIELVREFTKNHDIKYVCITDNDIVPPFLRDNKSCVLTKMIQVMDKHPEIGMCGVDLVGDNAPGSQEWWWNLRQHPITNPTFAEIAIGFWFAVTRYEYLKEFKFDGESLYGRVDESYRNWLTSVKMAKIGLLKGVSLKNKQGVHLETVPKLGIHLGWTEDNEIRYDYVLMKKQERYKAEQAWETKGKKW